MKAADRELFWDVFAGSVAVLVFVASIQLDKMYHGYHGLTLEDFVQLVYLSASWLVIMGMHCIGLKSVWAAARFWGWLSLLVGLGVHYRAVVIQEWGGAAAAAAVIAALAFGLWACRNATDRLRAGLRRLVIFLPGLIVISPVFAGLWLSKPVVWLAEDAGRYPAKTATVVLLFDEMNAQSSLGLQKVLVERGLNVSFKPVDPAHFSTTQVVPAVFTGRDFTGARACGLSVVCAEESVLDFSQVTVQRNDVDVVGFHHPYCAVQGLRSCRRFTTDTTIWEAARWGCAVQRIFGIYAGWETEFCQERAGTVWTNLQEQVSAGVLITPTLKDGGILYAHLPVPHPPAKGGGSLAAQYTQNVWRVEEVLSRLLDRMAEHGVEPRILIFSDHPLRQSMWCSREAAPFDTPCVVDPSLIDTKVPLIVAARTALPAIEHVQSNRQVFDVLRDWLHH